MTSTIGIPIKLLNEAQVRGLFPLDPTRFPASTPIKETSYPRTTMLTLVFLQGHVVTLEITSGQVYRGKLLEGSPHTPQHHPPQPQEKDADIWAL